MWCFIDLKKAFDIFNYKILFDKLNFSALFKVINSGIGTAPATCMQKYLATVLIGFAFCILAREW